MTSLQQYKENLRTLTDAIRVRAILIINHAGVNQLMLVAARLPMFSLFIPLLVHDHWFGWQQLTAAKTCLYMSMWPLCVHNFVYTTMCVQLPGAHV